MRELKIVPIVHVQEETNIPYTPQKQMAVKQAWEVIELVVRACYVDWKGVQLYIDGFTVPITFKDPELTVDGYKLIYLKRLVELNSPLGRVIVELLSKGAILESTEIPYKYFWLRYREVLAKAITNPVLYVKELDALDIEREKYISGNIGRTLKARGLFLIGRRHIGKFNFPEDVEVKTE